VDNALPSQTKTTESASVGGWGCMIRRRLAVANKHSLLALTDQLVVSGTSLLTTIIVGRFCGSDGLGLFTLAISAVILAKGVQDTLVSTPYTVFRSRLAERMTPEVHAGAALCGAALLVTILTTLALLTAFVFGISGQPWPVKALTWSLVIAIPLVLAREFARRFDMARMQMAGALMVDTGVAGVQITLLITLAWQGRLSSALAILIIGAACGVNLLLWWWRRKKTFVIDPARIVPAIKHDWEFGRWLLVDHLVCFAQLYAMHWLLTAMIDTSATGILAACAAIAGLASPVLQGIGNYLAPRFADTVSGGSRSETMRLYWRTTIALGIAVTGFAIIATVFAQQLLQILYDDPAYDGFGLVVGLLAFRLAFAIPTIAADHAVVAMEGPHGIVVATLAGLVTTFCLAIPLIHFYGVTGAAISLFVGTGIEMFVMLLVFVHYLGLWKWQDEE
jgi:O-antigen/teichoic acid export membrane protein